MSITEEKALGRDSLVRADAHSYTLQVYTHTHMADPYSHIHGRYTYTQGADHAHTHRDTHMHLRSYC